MTRIRQNGKHGEFDVVWGSTVKILTGIAITVLSTMLVSSVLLYTQVQLLDYRLGQVEKLLTPQPAPKPTTTHPVNTNQVACFPRPGEV